MIDSIPQEKLNLTKKLSIGNTMYVGGIPEKDIQLPESLVRKSLLKIFIPLILMSLYI